MRNGVFTPGLCSLIASECPGNALPCTARALPGFGEAGTGSNVHTVEKKESFQTLPRERRQYFGGQKRVGNLKWDGEEVSC